MARRASHGGPKMRRYTLKFAISTLVSGLILVSVAAIVAALYLGTKRALYLTTNEMMGQITHAMGDKLAQRLDGVERLNILLADLVRDGRLDPAREEAFADFLADALRANPAIASIDCGLPAGHKVQARRMPDGSISRRRVHRTATGVVTTWHHANPAYALEDRDGVEPLAAGYDPRVRPWYQAGLGGRMVWTGIYGTGSGLNCSNVNPVQDARGDLVCILAIDLNIGDLSVFLNGLKIGRTGKAFILDPAGSLVAMSLASEGDLGRIMKTTLVDGQPRYALRAAGEILDADVRAAVARLREAPGPAGRGFLSFPDAAGRTILASFRAEPLHQFTLGVVVPEDDILGPIKRSLDLTLLLACAALVLALAAAYGISRAIARPLAALAREVDRIRTLDLEGDQPVATAIAEVVDIDASIRNMKKGLRSFKKYVPSEVVTQLMAQGREAVIEGERRELTLFFSDIEGFTSISERVGPERLVAMLGAYFEGVTRILLAHGGTVDKYIGDSVMAFWGAPRPVPGHAEAACRAALEAQACIRGLNEAWAAQGLDPFPTRIGIHTGEATVGNIGFDARMNYTAIGDNVNLASRLEGLNKHYGTSILVSGATLEAAGGTLLVRKVDLVTVKGKDRPIGIHELLAMRGEAGAGLEARAARFDAAFAHYEARRWDEALAILEADFPAADGPALTLAARCRAFREAPPEPGWDGVFRHHEK
jgi:adenylate cyclase